MAPTYLNPTAASSHKQAVSSHKQAVSSHKQAVPSSSRNDAWDDRGRRSSTPPPSNRKGKQPESLRPSSLPSPPASPGCNGEFIAERDSLTIPEPPITDPLQRGHVEDIFNQLRGLVNQGAEENMRKQNRILELEEEVGRLKYQNRKQDEDIATLRHQLQKVEGERETSGEDHSRALDRNKEVEDQMDALREQHDNKPKDMDAKYRVSLDDIAHLKNTVTWQTNTIGEMNTRIETIEGRVTNFEGQVTNFEGQVTNLEGQVTNLEGQVNNLEGQVTNLEGQVTNLEGQVTALGGQVTTLEGQVTTLEGEVTALGGQVTTLTGNFDALTQRFDGSVARFNTFEADHSEQISRLEQNLNGINAALTDRLIQAEIRLTTFGETQVVANEQISRLEQTLNGAQNNITALGGRHDTTVSEFQNVIMRLEQTSTATSAKIETLEQGTTAVTDVSTSNTQLLLDLGDMFNQVVAVVVDQAQPQPQPSQPAFDASDTAAVDLTPHQDRNSQQRRVQAVVRRPSKKNVIWLRK